MQHSNTETYALSNCMDMNSALSVCPYCGGDCLLYPDDGESGCDGYLGDIDGLLSDRKPDDRLEVQGNYGNSFNIGDRVVVRDSGENWCSDGSLGTIESIEHLTAHYAVVRIDNDSRPPIGLFMWRLEHAPSTLELNKWHSLPVAPEVLKGLKDNPESFVLLWDPKGLDAAAMDGAELDEVNTKYYSHYLVPSFGAPEPPKSPELPTPHPTDPTKSPDGTIYRLLGGPDLRYVSWDGAGTVYMRDLASDTAFNKREAGDTFPMDQYTLVPNVRHVPPNNPATT